MNPNGESTGAKELLKFSTISLGRSRYFLYVKNQDSHIRIPETAFASGATLKAFLGEHHRVNLLGGGYPLADLPRFQLPGSWPEPGTGFEPQILRYCKAFPCLPGSKLPVVVRDPHSNRTVSGMNFSTSESAVVANWLQRGYNIGLLPDAGTLILDLDQKQAQHDPWKILFEACAALEVQLPNQIPTVMTATRGGVHLYLATELSCIAGRRRIANPHEGAIDVFIGGDAIRNYVLAAGSVVNGRRYEWEVPIGNSLPTAPFALVQFLQKRSAETGQGSESGATSFACRVGHLSETADFSSAGECTRCAATMSDGSGTFSSEAMKAGTSIALPVESPAKGQPPPHPPAPNVPYCVTLDEETQEGAWLVGPPDVLDARWQTRLNPRQKPPIACPEGLDGWFWSYAWSAASARIRDRFHSAFEHKRSPTQTDLSNSAYEWILTRILYDFGFFHDEILIVLKKFWHQHKFPHAAVTKGIGRLTSNFHQLHEAAVRTGDFRRERSNHAMFQRRRSGIPVHCGESAAGRIIRQLSIRPHSRTELRVAVLGEAASSRDKGSFRTSLCRLRQNGEIDEDSLGMLRLRCRIELVAEPFSGRRKSCREPRNGARSPGSNSNSGAYCPSQKTMGPQSPAPSLPSAIAPNEFSDYLKERIHAPQLQYLIDTHRSVSQLETQIRHIRYSGVSMRKIRAIEEKLTSAKRQKSDCWEMIRYDLLHIGSDPNDLKKDVGSIIRDGLGVLRQLRSSDPTWDSTTAAVARSVYGDALQRYPLWEQRKKDIEQLEGELGLLRQRPYVRKLEKKVTGLRTKITKLERSLWKSELKPLCPTVDKLNDLFADDKFCGLHHFLLGILEVQNSKGAKKSAHKQMPEAGGDVEHANQPEVELSGAV